MRSGARPGRYFALGRARADAPAVARAPGAGEPEREQGGAAAPAWDMLCPAMAGPPPKQALKEELVRLLQSDLDVLERAHRVVLEGATHEEAKPENDKDTRALEQSYLARGQAMRIEELRAGLGAVQTMALRAFGEGVPAALGALVSVDENGQERRFFLAPHGGGAALAGASVQVLTPESPLGRALLGKRAGDECEVNAGGRARELAVRRVD